MIKGDAIVLINGFGEFHHTLTRTIKILAITISSIDAKLRDIVILKTGDWHPEIPRDGENQRPAVGKINPDKANYIRLFNFIYPQSENDHRFFLTTNGVGIFHRGVLFRLFVPILRDKGWRDDAGIDCW